MTSRNIWALGWVSFFTDMAIAMIKPIIPIYVVYVLHQGMDKLGYVLAITTFVSYGLRWFGGWVSDHFQITKPLLLVGYGLSTVMNPLFGLAQTWVGIAVVSSLERLGKAIRSAPKDVLIAASSSHEHQGRSFGVHKTLDIAGETMGGLIAFVLLSWLGSSAQWIQQIFYWSLIPGLVAMVVLIFFVEDKVKQNRQAKVDTGLPISTTLWIMLALYFLSAFFMISDSFMLIRAHDISIDIAWLPLLVMFAGLIQVFISFIIGQQLDRHHFSNMILLGMLAAVASLALLMTSSTIAIIMAFMLQGIFNITLLNSLRVKIAKSQANKGKTFGIFYAGTAMTTALGAVMTGWLWENYDAHVALTIALTGMISVLIVSMIFQKSFNK